MLFIVNQESLLTMEKTLSSEKEFYMLCYLNDIASNEILLSFEFRLNFTFFFFFKSIELHSSFSSSCYIYSI